jgi:hypothetical protein
MAFPLLVLLWLFTPVVGLLSAYGASRAMFRPRIRLLLFCLVMVWMPVASVTLFVPVILLAGKLGGGEAGRFALNMFGMVLPLVLLVAFAAPERLREKALGLCLVLRRWAGSVPWDRIRRFGLASGRLVGLPVWRLVGPPVSSPLFWFVWHKVVIAVSLVGVTLSVAIMCVDVCVETPSFFIQKGFAPPTAQALAGLIAAVGFVTTVIALYFALVKSWAAPFLFRSYEAHKAMLAEYEAMAAGTDGPPASTM